LRRVVLKHSQANLAPIGSINTYSEWLFLLSHAVEMPSADLELSDEVARELYNRALLLHAELEGGAADEEIGCEAFVQTAVEHGLQAKGGGVTVSSRSMRGVNKAIGSAAAAPLSKPSGSARRGPLS